MILQFIIPSILFILFILLVVVSFKKDIEFNRYEIVLDKYCSSQLKGIAIICVLTGHLYMINFAKVPFTKYLGAQGVEVFLFISGYGLVKSYIKKGLSHKFLAKRFRVVLLPYFIISSILITINILVFKNSYSIQEILLWLVGLNITFDRSMWYISFILFWYLLFYLVFKMKINNKIRLIILFLNSIILLILSYNSPLEALNHEQLSHVFMFPIGCLAGLYSGNIFLSLSKKLSLNQILKTLYIAEALSISIFLLSFFFINKLVFYYICNISFTIFVVVFILIMRYYQRKSKLLMVIGSISYEIYLFEGFLMNKYNILAIFSNKILAFVVYITVVLILSIILKKLVAVIVNSYSKLATKYK